MDSNIEEEIDYNTSDTESLQKVKLTNDGTLVKIENTSNPNPFVLRLRRYFEPNNDDTTSVNHDDSQHAWDEGSRVSVSEIINSGDHSMNIEEHKSVTTDHQDAESHRGGLRRSHRTNNDQHGRKNYRKDLQEKLRITPDHIVSRKNPSDTTSSTLHKEDQPVVTPNKTHDKIPSKKNDPHENKESTSIKTPKESTIIQIKLRPVPVIDVGAEERRKATYKKACDHIGITHPLVQQHYKFIKSYFKEYVCSPYAFQQTCINSLELKKSHKITSGFYLLKLGQPFVPGFGTKQGYQTSDDIEFYDGFVSLRKYASFLNPGFLVYYYQTIIYLEEISQCIFVMIPEDREDLILFHSDPVKLLEFVFNKIREANKETTNYRKYKSQKKDNRFPDTSPLILRHKILSLYKLQSNFDVLLEDVGQALGLGQTLSGPVAVSEKKEFFLSKSKKILADDHMSQTLKFLFKRKMDYYAMEKPVVFAEYFFGLSHPKGVCLHEIIGKNQAMNFNQLQEKFKHHLTTISPYCEIKNLEIKFEDPETMGLGPTYKYQIERLLPDASNPSQHVWFTFDVCSKINVAEKTRQLSYSIRHTSQFKEEFTTTGDTPDTCLTKFLKKYTKTSGSRRIMLEWADRLFDVELKSHENKDNILEMLVNMYDPDVDTEKSYAEVQVFNGLIDEKHSGILSKYSLALDAEKQKLYDRAQKVSSLFADDENIIMVDDQIFLTSEAI